jgi:hypothetical protein
VLRPIVREVDLRLRPHNDRADGRLDWRALRAFSAEVLGLPTVGLIAARGETDASADEVRFLNPVTGDHGGGLRGVVGLIDGGWRYELVHATSVSGDRTDVARVGRDGKVEVLGTIDRALACAATDGVLVCTHPVNPNLAENRDYTVGVWSLPSGVG